MSRNNQTMNNLSKIATKKRLNWADEFAAADDNIEWQVRSAIISTRVLLFLKRRDTMDRAALAEKMEVSVQYLSKLLKGKENMTLKTITKLEASTGMALLHVYGEKMEGTETTVQGADYKSTVEATSYSSDNYSIFAPASTSSYASVTTEAVIVNLKVA